MDRIEPDPQDEQDPGEQDGAERAFEDLRAEVAALRRGIELIYRQGQDAQGPAAAGPDYSPTLGAIAKELQAVTARLDAIEGHPAMRLTPAAYATQVTAGVRRMEDEAARSLTNAQGRFSDGLQELRGLIGSANSQFVQQRREWVATAIGAVLGFVVWYPLVFLTPWGGGHWLAATLIGGGPWRAGETLMQEADPAVWERMVRLYRACPADSATELCEAALSGRTIPPVTQDKTKGAVVSPPRSLPHSRAGQQVQ